MLCINFTRIQAPWEHGSWLSSSPLDAQILEQYQKYNIKDLLNGLMNLSSIECKWRNWADDCIEVFPDVLVSHLSQNGGSKHK
jgi:hypothetical protein